MMGRPLVVKREPELRHVLAHLYYAIDALRQGLPRLALLELQSIEGLVFWGTDDEEVERWIRAAERKERAMKRKKKKGGKKCK